jgi:hypothetical protein
MSAEKRKSRFGYLSEQETSPAPAVPAEDERSKESEEQETSEEDGERTLLDRADRVPARAPRSLRRHSRACRRAEGG